MLLRFKVCDDQLHHLHLESILQHICVYILLDVSKRSAESDITIPLDLRLFLGDTWAQEWLHQVGLNHLPRHGGNQATVCREGYWNLL